MALLCLIGIHDRRHYDLRCVRRHWTEVDNRLIGLIDASRVARFMSARVQRREADARVGQSIKPFSRLLKAAKFICRAEFGGMRVSNGWNGSTNEHE